VSAESFWNVSYVRANAQRAERDRLAEILVLINFIALQCREEDSTAQHRD
jgi:hypothetical protein